MNIDSTRKGERQISLRSLFTAMLLMVVALAAILGFTSTKTFAAENNSSIVPDKASEVVLTSSATGDVAQPVTDADYAKLNAQYKVTPDGTPTIQSKTQNVETLTTKDGNKDKSYTKTTTKWVISDEDKTPATEPASQENPGSKTNVGPFIFAPITLKPSVPALLGGAALGAVPALAAVPAAFLAGGVLPTVGALAAVPAAFVAGQAANALPAALTGAALNAVPAALTGAALNAIPAFTAGALANAIPAALTGAALNAIPAFTAGVLATLVPARLALGASGALHALANPFSLGGPLFKIVKGSLFPLAEITKDHIEDIAVPATLGALALARLPLQVLGALHAIANPLSFGGPLFRAVKGFLFPATEIVKDHLQDALRNLAALPLAALVGAALNAIPAALVGGALALTGAALLGRALLGLSGALHALANPFSFGGPLFKILKGNLFPLAEITKDHIEDIAVPAFLLGQATMLPLIGAALGLILPAALIGAALGFIPGLLIGAAAATLAALTLGRLALGALGALHALANPLSFGGPLFKILKGNLFPLAEILKDHLEDLLGASLLGALAAAIPALLTGLVLGSLAAIPAFIAGLLLGALDPFLGTGVVSLAVRVIRDAAVAVGLILALVLPNPLLAVLAVIPVAAALVAVVVADVLFYVFRTVVKTFALLGATLGINIPGLLVGVLGTVFGIVAAIVSILLPLTPVTLPLALLFEGANWLLAVASIANWIIMFDAYLLSIAD